MVTKNFDVVITELDGTVLQEGVAGKNEDGTPKQATRDLTIKNAVISVLKNTLKGDENFTYKDIFRLMDIAERINAGGDTKVESDEVTTIKERIAKGWPYIVSYRVQKFLEE